MKKEKLDFNEGLIGGWKRPERVKLAYSSTSKRLGASDGTLRK